MAPDLGRERMYMGTGGCATSDGGVGMLQALGGLFMDEGATGGMITLLDQGLEGFVGLGFALLSACGAMLHPGIDIMLRITKAERAFQRFLVTTGKPLEWLCA